MAYATYFPDTTYISLLRDKTATGAGSTENGKCSVKTYQANGLTTAGSGSATIVVQGSNDEGTSWDTIGTITLTLGTSRTSDSFTSDDRYLKIRGNVTALSGTGALVNLIAAY